MSDESDNAIEHMAATTVGVVYSIAQKKRRMLIVPDDDKELNDPAWTPPGTAIWTLDLATYQKMAGAELDAALAQAVGPALSDRCVTVTAAGSIVGAICADPAIDVLPGLTVIQSDTMAIGGTFLNGVYVAPVAAIHGGSVAGNL